MSDARKPDLEKLKVVGAELSRCGSALFSMAPSVAKADMMYRLDGLIDEQARALGLSEDEIAKINEEAEGDDYVELIEFMLGDDPSKG